MKTLSVKRLDENATLPTRGHEEDAGLDLYASVNVAFSKDDVVVMVPTSVAVGLEPGYVGLVRDRSSVSKRGLKVTAGVIDAGYTGEVVIAFLNLSRSDGTISKGDKIAQMLVLPIATPKVEEVSDLSSSTRGAKGWGSTGK